MTSEGAIDKIPSKIDLAHAEDCVAFSFRDCSLDKNFSFFNLSKDEAKRFICKLKHIEQMTWKQLGALPREDGLTPESPGTKSFDMIYEQSSSSTKITEPHFFHTRVERTGKFRVFGYQDKFFFCITHIDPNGKIHNH